MRIQCAGLQGPCRSSSQPHRQHCDRPHQQQRGPPPVPLQQAVLLGCQVGISPRPEMFQQLLDLLRPLARQLPDLRHGLLPRAGRHPLPLQHQHRLAIRLLQDHNDEQLLTELLGQSLPQPRHPLVRDTALPGPPQMGRPDHRILCGSLPQHLLCHG